MTSQQDEVCVPSTSSISLIAASLIIECVDDKKSASNSKSSYITSANRFSTISGNTGGKVKARHEARSSNFLNLENIYFHMTVSISDS